MIRNAVNAIKFYPKLWWFKRKRESVLDNVYKQMEQAKTEHEREGIWHENQWDLDISQQTVQSLQSRYYLDVARRKGIPRPEGQEDWEEVIWMSGVRVLTEAAIVKLKSAIRQDQKELREIFIPIGTVLISCLSLSISFLNYRKPVSQPQPTQQTQTLTPIPTPLPSPSTTPTSKAQKKTHQTTLLNRKKDQ